MLSKPQKASIAIIGDSHANQYYQSVAKKLPDSNVLNFGYPGCLPFSAHQNCKDEFDETVQFIKNDNSIDTVIITGYFSFLGAGFKYGNIEGLRVANDLTVENRRVFGASADKLLSTLISLNKKVIVFIDIPDLVFKPRECVAFQNPVMAFLRGAVKSKGGHECGILVSEFQNRNQTHDNALSGILSKYPKIEVFNPRPLLCDARICAARKNDRFLYWNSDHLTIEGADMVIDAFIKEKGSVLSHVLRTPKMG